MKQAEPMIGKRFGRLTVLEECASDKRGRSTSAYATVAISQNRFMHQVLNLEEQNPAAVFTGRG